MPLEDEIRAMNAYTQPPEDPEQQTQTQDQETKTDPPATEPPSAQEDENKTDAPKTTPPATEPPPDELTTLRAKVLELEDKLKPKPTTPPKTEAPVETVDFIGDVEDVEDLLRDKDELNKLLNKVYQQGMKVSRATSTEIINSVPEKVKTTVDVVLALKEATQDFFGANEDLRPFNKVVSTVYGELAESHPDWTFKKCLEETGIETRKRLNLKVNTPTPDPKDKAKKPPTLPPGTKGQRKQGSKPEPSAVQRQIDEMNASLE